VSSTHHVIGIDDVVEMDDVIEMDHVERAPPPVQAEQGSARIFDLSSTNHVGTGALARSGRARLGKDLT
jgi:hypothetical protein